MSSLRYNSKGEYKMSNGSGAGVGFFGLLTIVFIALKLTEYINWSWWWVLSPIWIPAVFVFLLATTIAMFHP
jgi:hypothetical protein